MGERLKGLVYLHIIGIFLLGCSPLKQIYGGDFAYLPSRSGAYPVGSGGGEENRLPDSYMPDEASLRLEPLSKQEFLKLDGLNSIQSNMIGFAGTTLYYEIQFSAKKGEIEERVQLRVESASTQPPDLYSGTIVSSLIFGAGHFAFDLINMDRPYFEIVRADEPNDLVYFLDLFFSRQTKETISGVKSYVPNARYNN